MRMAILGLLVVLVALMPAAGVDAEPGPRFKLGFKILADQLPEEVGQPLEDEHWSANGDSLQATTKGLMVWRKADNWTAFTNGWWTWVNGPFGIQSRPNGARLDWEREPPPPAPMPEQAVAVPAQAAPALDNAVETRYYEVRGTTAAELLAGLTSSPCGEGNWGCTSWNFSVSFFRRADGSYAVPPGAPFYHIRVLLPRWVPPADASEDLMAAWQRMVAALEAHEKEHVDIALAGLASMRDAIERAGSAEEADAACRAGKLRIEQDEQYYDWVTDHGKKQGVYFP